MAVEIRPPRPGMQGRELDQWLDRMYQALSALSTGGEVTTVDHNDLENNGGDNSHEAISNHIGAKTAHGVSTPVVGVSDEQTLVNKTIDAENNTISNLKHGEEVDNPAAAHGVDEIVGTTEEQTLTHKTIDADNNDIINLKHGEEVDNPTAAHGVGEVIGADEEQTLTNKTIDAENNTINNLKHGEEVDNPTAAHGVDEVVGTTEKQTLTNKDVRYRITTVPSVPYLVQDTDGLLRVTLNNARITFPKANENVGRKLTVANKSSTEVVLIPRPGDTIHGEATQTLPLNSTAVFYCDGAEWRLT